MIIIVRAVFHEDSFFHECLYKLYMLYFDRVVISEAIDVNKTRTSKKCDTSHYCFLDKGFNSIFVWWLLLLHNFI